MSATPTPCPRTPESTKTGTVTAASLEPRRWWTFAGPRSAALLGILSTLVVLAVEVYVAIGIAIPALIPTPAALWAYPAAIVGVVFVLAGATYLALRTSAHRLSNTRPGNAAQDNALHSVSARIVSGMTGAALFGYLAANVATIGADLATLGQIGSTDGLPIAALSIAGVTIQVVSAGLIACSISSLAAAISIAVSFAATPRHHRLLSADQVAS